MAWSIGRRGRLVLGTILSLLGGALAFRGVRLTELAETLARGNYVLITLALAINFLAYGATALRWRLLFYPCSAPTFHQLFSGLMVAQLANATLPARLGAVTRAYWISELSGVSKGYALGTIMLEKAVEGLTLLPVLTLLPLFSPLPAGVRETGLILSALLVCISLLLVILYRHQDGLFRFFSTWPWDQVSDHVLSVVDGLGALQAKRVGRSVWAWSVGIWMATALSYYFALRAFQIRVPLVAVFVILVVLQVGARVPALPAGIGVFHYLVVLSLGVFSVGANAAASYAVVLHGMIFLVPGLLGALYLWKGHYDLNDLRSTGAPSEVS